MADILESLKKAITQYDAEGAARLARKAIVEGIDPVEALKALTQAVRRVGDGYSRGELWLPDLVGAASAMESAVPVIEARIKELGAKRESSGLVVLGTVQGDIHNIGKDMVSVLARANGFEVIDLGVDIPASSFVEAVKKNKPEILAMSALMTTTAYMQKEVIQALNEQALRDKVKVAVGGGAITKEFATTIGADGYSPTAPGGVELFQRLVGLK